MTAEEFLENVLVEQAVETDSDEHADLIEEHDSIATLLARELPAASPSVELGGSLAKGTMVRASYDLDSICYFDNDDNGAGETLKEIREAVETALKSAYCIEGDQTRRKAGGRARVPC